MDVPLPSANILFLPGISLADHISVEDTFDAKILETVEKEEERISENILPYDKIPAQFTTIEEWPHSTNLRCWSCCLHFDTVPWFVPTYIWADPNKTDSIIAGVEGSFCTPNCAARYINDTYPPQGFSSTKHWRRHSYLRIIYSRFTGHHVAQIEPAPSRTERQEFGGPFSEDEFWGRLRKLDPKQSFRDHRSGVILPERLRGSNDVSVWDICRLSTPAEPKRDSFDWADLDQLLESFDAE